MSVSETLLELQAVDTATDQLAHRRSTLPELEAMTRARDALVGWERRRTALRARLDQLQATIDGAEEANAEIDTHRTRLEAQLRTVIAPREAEALQSEIAGLAAKRDEHDERELAALEEQAALDDELTELLRLEESLRAAFDGADTALAAVQRDLDREAVELDRRRDEIRGRLDAVVLARYDSLRAHHGVAVVRFGGKRCDGCHLDLSPAEVDVVKDTAEGELADCPQCGRLLVR